MNLDVSIPSPKSILVVLEGEEMVEVEDQYENIPCSQCLLAGHRTTKCLFVEKLGILRTPSHEVLPSSEFATTVEGSLPLVTSTANEAPRESATGMSSSLVLML